LKKAGQKLLCPEKLCFSGINSLIFYFNHQCIFSKDTPGKLCFPRFSKAGPGQGADSPLYGMGQRPMLLQRVF
jgi:hypothetical protein